MAAEALHAGWAQWVKPLAVQHNAQRAPKSHPDPAQPEPESQQRSSRGDLRSRAIERLRRRLSDGGDLGADKVLEPHHLHAVAAFQFSAAIPDF